MRWTRRILLAASILVVVVVVVLGAALAALMTMDLSRFKGNVESYVSEATGRHFAIEGQFQPEFGWTIDLVAEDVRLANAEWGTAENILSLERLVVSVDLWSLVRGPVWIKNLEIEGLTAHVEVQEETGKSVWDFSDAADSTSADNEGSGFPGSGELPLVLERARLRDIDVTYGQGWLDAPRHARVGEATFMEGDRGLLELALSGALDGDPLHAAGRIGPLTRLISGRDLQWELDLRLGQVQCATRGRFRNLFALEGPEVNLQMKGPSAEVFLARLGLPHIARGAIELTGYLREGNDGIEARIAGAFGDLTTDVTGHAESLHKYGNGSLSMEIQGANLQAIGDLFGAGFLPPHAFGLKGTVTGSQDALVFEGVTAKVGAARLVVDGRIGLSPDYGDARLSIEASGPEIQRLIDPALKVSSPSGPFELNGTLVGNVAMRSLEDFVARVGSHELAVHGTVGRGYDTNGLDLDVKARGPNLKHIVGPWAENEVPAEAYKLRARVRRQDAGFALDDVTVAVGDANLEVVGTTGVLPALAGLDAMVAFSGPDLQALVEPWVEVVLPAEPFEIRGHVQSIQSALQFSDVTFSLAEVRGTINGTTGVLPGIDGLRLDLDFSGPNAQRVGAAMEALGNVLVVPPNPFETRATIRYTDSSWFIDTWILKIGDDRLEIAGTLGDLENVDRFNLSATASGADLRDFLPDRGLKHRLPYKANVRIDFGENVIGVKNLDVQVGDSSGFVNGRISVKPHLADANFEVRLWGQDLRQLGRILNVAELPSGPFRFEGALSQQGSTYVVQELVAEVAGNDFAGNIKLEFEPNRKLSVRLELDKLDLTKIFATNESGQNEVSKNSKSDRRIPANALPLQTLDLDKLSVELGTAALKYGGTLNAVLDVTRKNKTDADVYFKLAGQQVNLGRAIDGDGNPIIRPAMDLNIELSGSGSTVRDLAASANGLISLRLGEGEIDNFFSGYFLRDVVSRVSDAINPLAKNSPHTNLQCGILEIDVLDGIARTRVAGLQTDKLAAASIGTVNLETEALDLSFRTMQREGIGVSVSGTVSPYIKLGGTLANPSLKLDKKRGFLSGTVAVLTGGLSILAQGVWDRYLSADDFCAAVIAGLESGEIAAGDGQPEDKKKRLRPFRRNR